MNTTTFGELRRLGNTPRFHGNGFVQLYIGENKRLHIWHPQLPAIRDHNATIHDHRYDVRSSVLHGRLLHTIYAAIDEPEGEYQINLVVSSDPGKGHPEPTPERCIIEPIGWYEIAAGSEYLFPHRWFHTSESNELTVTIFEQVDDHPDYRPRVISPYGEPPQHAFDPATTPGEDVLWSAIWDACELSNVHYRIATELDL